MAFDLSIHLVETSVTTYYLGVVYIASGEFGVVADLIAILLHRLVSRETYCGREYQLLNTGGFLSLLTYFTISKAELKPFM